MLTVYGRGQSIYTPDCIHYIMTEETKTQTEKKEAGKLFDIPEYGHDPDGYLYHNSKKVMVQIGSTFYALKEWDSIPETNNEGIDKLEVILDKFDVRLLKEG